MAGGLSGVLVMWNRHRSEHAGQSRWRRYAVLAAGSAASVCALVAFAKAFGAFPSVYAAMVTIIMTGWAAVWHSAARLPVPAWLLRVRAGEFAFLDAAWTGVRSFGALLRHTPLRHLGGRVYLRDTRDPQAVLRGIRDAESVHLWALLGSGPWLMFWAARGQWLPVLCALAVHVPLNVYPILHLRHATWRIENFAARTRRSTKT